jgi:primosomal protein N' (replication factor Y)
MRYSVVAGVVVEKTAYRFDKPFDYLVPPELISQCKIGCRVTVPFGRGNTKRQGVVLYLSEDAQNIDVSKVKNILSVIDKKPLLNEEFLGIVKWLKAHTFCTYYDAVKTLLPFGLNLKMVSTLYLAEDLSSEQLATLSKEENDVVALLRKKGGSAEKNSLLKVLGLSDDSLITTLIKKGVVFSDLTAKQNMRDPTVSMLSLVVPTSDLPKLTEKQKSVVDFLDEVGSASLKETLYYTGVTQAVVTALEKKGILKVYSVSAVQQSNENQITDSGKIFLTGEQQKAYESLLTDYNLPSAKTSLIYGVTGSGKTSVFLKLVDYTISSGKSATAMPLPCVVCMGIMRTRLPSVCNASSLPSLSTARRKASGKADSHVCLSATMTGVPLMGSLSRFPLSHSPTISHVTPFMLMRTVQVCTAVCFEKSLPPNAATNAAAAASTKNIHAEIPSLCTSPSGKFALLSKE